MSFTLDMKKVTEKTTGNIELAVKAIVRDVAETVIEMSPVGDPESWDVKFIEAAVLLEWIPEEGYVGGRFRGNWDYGFNAAPDKEYDIIDKTGAVSMARIEAGLAGNKSAGIHYLANNLPYAQRLENGYSKQAPAGMVGLTVIKFQSIVDRSVSKIR